MVSKSVPSMTIIGKEMNELPLELSPIVESQVLSFSDNAPLNNSLPPGHVLIVFAAILFEVDKYLCCAIYFLYVSRSPPLPHIYNELSSLSLLFPHSRLMYTRADGKHNFLFLFCVAAKSKSQI